MILKIINITHNSFFYILNCILETNIYCILVFVFDKLLRLHDNCLYKMICISIQYCKTSVHFPMKYFCEFGVH